VCERLRLPHFPDNLLTGGGEVVSRMRRPPFTPRNIPGSNFCWRLNRTQGRSAAESIRSIKNPMTSARFDPATFQLIA
jgi:hypothetical protein